MHIIACVDERNGMSFGGRRQSKDRVVYGDILDLAEGKTIHMSAYSAAQFDQAYVQAEDLFLENAQAGDICFVENVDATAYLKKASRVTLYRWNRLYPADLHFPELKEWMCIRCAKFSGYSHETITREEYIPWQEEPEKQKSL